MTIAASMLAEFDMELAATRRTLASVPEAHADWKPHAKSFALGALASHLASVPLWGVMTLTRPELDLGSPEATNGGAVPFTTTAALLERFDGLVVACREALAGSSDEAMMANWTLRHGANAMFTMPRVVVMRSTVMNHMIHHRGQLTVYLRMLDVPVPELYGPTADSKRG